MLKFFRYSSIAFHFFSSLLLTYYESSHPYSAQSLVLTAVAAVVLFMSRATISWLVSGYPPPRILPTWIAFVSIPLVVFGVSLWGAPFWAMKLIGYGLVLGALSRIFFDVYLIAFGHRPLPTTSASGDASTRVAKKKR
jgi:hypothetical protein